MRKQKGFSLIELHIVVAIILIIAAIAIPNLLRARISANESSAVGSVRTINTGQVTYQTSYPTEGFSDTVAKLGPPAAGAPPTSTTSGVIDGVLAAGSKSGYNFYMTNAAAATPRLDYTVSAGPVNFNQTGVRNFCSNSDGVIRGLITNAAAIAAAVTSATCGGATYAPLQ